MTKITKYRQVQRPTLVPLRFIIKKRSIDGGIFDFFVSGKNVNLYALAVLDTPRVETLVIDSFAAANSSRSSGARGQ
jgi:hypothetical protein